jgi:hypothetical protein
MNVAVVLQIVTLALEVLAPIEQYHTTIVILAEKS